MAFTFDDIQNHKQVVVGSKSSRCIGTNDTDDQKILGSEYIENALNVGEPDRFDKMEGTVMINASEEQQGEYAVEVKDGIHVRRSDGKPGGGKPDYAVNVSEGDVQIKDDLDVRDNLYVGDGRGNDATSRFSGTSTWVDEEDDANTVVITAGTVVAADEVTADGITLTSRKPFDIPHPSKKNWRLRHICLEGPESAVYARGRISGGANVIHLPEYWRDLVDGETITVNLTPIGTNQNLFVEEIKWGNQIVIGNEGGSTIDCYYTVYGERKDGEKLIPEYEGKGFEDYPGDNSQYAVPNK